MNIVADENIPYATEAFSTLGKVKTYPGRKLKPADVKDADILLVRSVTPVNEKLLAGSKVRFVASATIGFDHIDSHYLDRQGIPWTTAPGCNATAAAEYVLAALLHALPDTDIRGKTAGIIGCGNVGSRVQTLLEALDIHCLINDPPRQQREPATKFATLEDALKADFVTLHVPLTKAGQYPTFHLLDHKQLSLLKPGAVLINAARGAALNTQALLAHLNENKLSAIIDCWENEPNIHSEMLEKAQIGTPHIAGYSLDGRVRGTDMIYQATCQFLKTSPTWQASDVLQPPLEATIDIRHINEPMQAIRKAVNHAYNIEMDHQRLLQTIGLTDSLRGAEFDRQRKEYPLRREFSQFTLITNNQQQPDLENTLQQLGFKIQNNSNSR